MIILPSSIFMATMAIPSSSELAEAIPVILSLVVIEGLLSVDNALAIAAMASHLPEKQKYLALRLGIIGAYVFRGLALFFAAWIIANPWLKIVGSAYLIFLMCQHFTGAADENDDGADDNAKTRGLWATVIAIELMDLSLSVDNVVAAVAFSPKLWIVCIGVFIGILALRFVAGLCIKLIEKFPILEHTAFLLIGYVGVILVVELTTHTKVNALDKFIGIILIILSTIIYSKSAFLKKALEPIIKGILWLMRPVAFVVGLLLKAILWPIKKIILIVGKQFKMPKSA
jgi:YkoY family integral membrane protein